MNGTSGIVSVPEAGQAVRIELSNEPRFSRRVRRLGVVSLVAPGLIWWVAATRLATPQPLLVAQLAGWWLMPAVPFASLPFPSIRPPLIIPATLITAPVLAIVAGRLPGQPIAGLGWLLVAAGLLLGDLMGGCSGFVGSPCQMPSMSHSALHAGASSPPT
jgi:hypothetical protein